jgi:hypothetical protein
MASPPPPLALIEPYLSTYVVRSNHYLCPADQGWEYRIVHFKRCSTNENDIGWLPCGEDDASVGLEVCSECFLAGRLHDGILHAELQRLGDLSRAEFIEKCKTFKKFHVLWERKGDSWCGMDDAKGESLYKALQPLLARLHLPPD